MQDDLLFQSLLWRDLSKISSMLECFTPITMCFVSEETIASDPVFKRLLLAAQHEVEIQSDCLRLTHKVVNFNPLLRLFGGY